MSEKDRESLEHELADLRKRVTKLEAVTDSNRVPQQKKQLSGLIYAALAIAFLVFFVPGFGNLAYLLGMGLDSIGAVVVVGLAVLLIIIGGLKKSTSPSRDIILDPDPIEEDPHPDANESEKGSVGEHRHIEAKPLPPLDLERLIGQKTLNIVGVIALIFAVGFFLKYAFDNNWIGPSGRIIIGVLAGVILITAGEKLKRVTGEYGFVLTGGGISILYLSIFAAHNAYHLLDFWLAFVFMALITAAAASLAVLNSNMIIGLFGVIGGFLAPVMLSTGGAASISISLFIYLGVLDIGVLGVSFAKKWRLLEVLSFAFTQMYIFSAYDFNLALEVSTVFFIIFFLISIMHNFIRSSQAEPEDLLLLIGNPAVYLILTSTVIISRFDDKMLAGFVAIIIAAIYLGATYITRTLRANNQYLILAFLGVATSAAAVSLPLILGFEWAAVGWSIEAGALVLMGIELDSSETRLVGIIGWVLVAVSVYISTLMNGWTSPLGELFPATVVLTIVALVLFLVYMKRVDQEDNKLAKEAKDLSSFFAVMINLLLLRVLSSLIGMILPSSMVPPSLDPQYFGVTQTKQVALSTLWSFYAAAVLTVGFLIDYKAIRLFGMGLLGVTIVKVFIFDLSFLSPVYRILSLLILGLILLGASYMYQSNSRFEPTGNTGDV